MIWHIQVPSKLRMFVWHLAKHSMPCGEVLKHRHMTTEDTCLLCGERDTWKHALFSCPLAAAVWALAPEDLLEPMIERTEEKAKDWLFEMHALLPTDMFQRLIVTLWAIWKARRKAIHEDIYQPPHSINGFINNYLRDLQFMKPRHQTPRGAAIARSTRWVKPCEGAAKINVDTAVSRRGYGAVGAICRDQAGAFLGASTLFFKHIIDPQTLEALAIREAFSLAEDLYLRRIHVASDCKGVVDDIKKENVASYGAIIHEIIDHSISFVFCNFSHEFRSSNVEAHNLAKHALNLGGGRHAWLGHPGNL